MFPFLIPHMVTSGVRMAMSPQQFCLRWNNHQSNIISVFEQLLQNESFVDVTLAVEGMMLKAHKVVLSACSPYFQAVLASHPDKHPIVILKDVRYTDMRDLLDFMYRGEVSVDQDNLSGFLRVAESLRIKGLTEVNEKKRLENSSTAYLMPQAMPGAAPPGVAPGVVPTAPLTPLAGDPPPLKRPPLSPSACYGAKRRRGRPPKISGEESEGEVGSVAGSISAADGEDTRSEAEVKIEAEEVKECPEPDDQAKEPDTKSGESTPGPSGESQGKEVTRLPQEEQENTRDSPGSGHVPEWTTHEYDPDDHHAVAAMHTAIKSNSQPPPLPPPPPTTDIDQLYYTKNLLEAAMLKNPYEALKNDKHLHGSILLASLRAPLKFGLHGVYERDDREHIDSSPHSPLTSPQKPTQSSPTSISPSSGSGSERGERGSGEGRGGGGSGGNNKVSVPIMSYCIQDNGFKCSKCFQTFTHPSNFHRHYITVHTDRRAHKCHVCGKEFKRKDNMMSHIRSVHRPGKEGHTIFRDVSSVSPSLPREVPHLQEQLMQQMQQVDKV
ncbi:protein tramtrack, beta isoform-like isoform X1 [Palaemon carinicauda]|uniref:protein tramtrack, beta isoform-like isoform X1 n=2 Tax=Palaemon carinicauda TaxID=392227 RepID=UPI0035B64627